MQSWVIKFFYLPQRKQSFHCVAQSDEDYFFVVQFELSLLLSVFFSWCALRLKTTLRTLRYYFAYFAIKALGRPVTKPVATLFIKLNLNCCHEYRI